MLYGWRRYALFLCVLLPQTVCAADLSVPSSADVGRIKPFDAPLIRSRDEAVFEVPKASFATNIPEGADEVRFTLNSVRIDGASAIPQAELELLYAKKLGQPFRLGDIWRLAAAITQRYRESGYFLSRAFVPAQNVKGGQIQLRVIEGYVSDVTIEGNATPSRIRDAYIQKLIAQRPISAAALESFMLRLEDLPGVSYHAVIRPSREVGGGSGAGA